LGYRDNNIKFRQYGNEAVELRGGKTISVSEFSKSSDDRIKFSVRDKVLKINLEDEDIPAPKFCITGHSQYYLSGAGISSGGVTSTVYADGKMMNIARYPNDGYMTIESVIQNGNIDEESKDYKKPMKFTVSDETVKNWENADNAYVFGYWYYDWSDQTAPVASIVDGVIETTIPSAYGLRKGQRVYIYNLLEELDSEGEWYYDKNSGDFYFYPPEGCTEVTLAFESGNLFELNESDSVGFFGLKMSGAENGVICAMDCDYLTIRGCDIAGCGESGIYISGKNADISDNTVSETGATGISVAGGDKVNLISANNRIYNNNVFNTSKIVKTYAPGIRINGVGAKVEDNTIYNAPHSGIIFGGNDHVIAGNEIYDVLTESADAGAIYCGRSMISRGTVIKDNFIHDLKTDSLAGHGVMAVYLDDCMSGITIEKNHFENISGKGVFINGGRDNKVINNTFNNISGKAVDLSTAGLTDWYGDDEAFVSTQGLSSGIHTTEPYSKYEHLFDILDDDFRWPKYNVIQNNSFEKCSEKVGISIYNNNYSIEQIKAVNTIKE